MSDLVELLLQQLDRGFDKASWHGPNLRGAIRRVDARQAAWRPARDRHNIWEIVVHAAYWKYAVRRRLLGEKRGSFPLSGSNWFTRPAPSSATWADDVQLLISTHQRLRDAVANLVAADVWRSSGGKKLRNWDLVMAIAAHDIYHAGQIQYLKRLARSHGDRRDRTAGAD